MVTNVEEFMYRLMACLYSINVPIIFKGAMVLKAIQYQFGNPSGLERETHDLDGDWVNGTQSMAYLTSVLQQAVRKAGYQYVTVVPYREYGSGKSAGFKFIDSNGKEVTTMDLSIRPNSFSCKYSLINGLSFCGQTVNKIIADKIQVCSSRIIVRRIKDIIDLYILSYIWRGSNYEILEISNILGRSFDNFDRFINSYNDLEHAYSRYKNKATVLPFNHVYHRVYLFLEPFVRRINYTVFWDGNNWR